jgi:hypothetical protein
MAAVGNERASFGDADAEDDTTSGGSATELSDRPGWSAGLQGSVGLSTLFGSETRSAFSLAGAIVRAHYGYVSGGLFYEATDDFEVGGGWQNMGGFVGAYLPYERWLDFDLALRGGARRYSDDDPQFGPTGYAFWAAAVGLAVGVSDRTSDDAFAGRLGGFLVGTYDINQEDEPWRLESADPDTGVRVVSTGPPVGGFTVALEMTLGLDIAGK